MLIDGDTVVWDSMAFLVYLARRHGDEMRLTAEAIEETRVMPWLAVSQNEILSGLARARASKRLNRPYNLEQCQKEGRAVMESRLQDNDRLASEHATIADIVCSPPMCCLPLKESSLQPYLAVRAWLDRVCVGFRAGCSWNELKGGEGTG